MARLFAFTFGILGVRLLLKSRKLSMDDSVMSWIQNLEAVHCTIHEEELQAVRPVTRRSENLQVSSYSMGGWKFTCLLAA